MALTWGRQIRVTAFRLLIKVLAVLDSTERFLRIILLRLVSLKHGELEQYNPTLILVLHLCLAALAEPLAFEKAKLKGKN